MTGFRWREHLGVLAAAAVVTALLTYPVSRHPRTTARIDSSDGQFSIWNVSWVARTIVADPIHVFDANIFYPHRGTLLYSEANLVAGILAAPVYWTSRNPYFAHNSVLMLSFFLCAVGMYWLVFHLTGNRWGSAVAAISFAFCPYLYAHTTHIQLLMTPGIPFSMLAFHRLADRPTNRRAAVLGLAMALTVYSCAYYGVFIVLMVGFAVLLVAALRRQWKDTAYWSSMLVAGGVSAALVLPLFLPYALRERSGGFTRTLREAQRYAANWYAYAASSAWAHFWLPYLHNRWTDAAFPGVVATAFGVGRLVTAHRLRGRAAEIVILYGSITIAAFWISLGPSAGLYSLLYWLMPGFSLMRAPVRFALIVAFGLAVLAGLAVQALMSRARVPLAVGGVLVALTLAEHYYWFSFRPVPPPSPAYDVLARQAPAPVIEMPFFEQPPFFPRHSFYMLMSTRHWMPLVNGYSDYTPPDFQETAVALAPFPFPRAFARAKELGVRYAMFHLNVYDARTRAEVEGRLREFAPYLRELYADADTRLYEISGFPPQ